ncbi:MAG: hypothetical protein JWN52_2796 [Actinomycetia bacterium]|nr:hypothetical protein [Actinomycetes bacterium]
MTTATLRAHGRLTWADARTLLAGATCAWTDLDGAHLGPAPETAPVGASHLWAWTGRWCARLRFDDDAVYCGVLHLDASSGETVTVTIRTGLRLWGPGDLQAGPVPAGAADQEWELLEVNGDRPVTFVRARAGH